MAWTDDFQRADGAIGANWGQPQGTTTIVSGRPSNTSGTGRAVCLAASEVGPHTASITLDLTATWGVNNRPWVKMPDNGTAGYYGELQGSSGTYTAAIYRLSGTAVLLASHVAPITLPNPTVLSITYNAGNLYYMVNGTVWAWARDTTLDGNTRTGMGIAGSGRAITLFTTETPDSATFSVSPAWAQTSGSPVQLYFYGQNTSWTIGSPGTPTFTVSAGSLANQQVATPTTASAVFTPPNSDQNVTVTDPSTGLTDSIQISSQNPGGGPAGFAPKLTDDGAALINTTATHYDGDLFRWNTTVIGPGENTNGLTIRDAIAQIWLAEYRWGQDPPVTVEFDTRLDDVLKWISGGYIPTMATPAPPPQTTLKQDLEELLAQLSDIRTQNDWTLGSVITELAGEGVPQHTDILAAIAGISGGSNQDVLDRLDEIQGEGGYSLRSLTLLLDTLRTIHDYNLGDVVDRLDARPTNLALAAAVASIQASIAALAVEVGVVGAAVTAAAAETTTDLASDLAAALALATGVADILLKLAELKELLGGAAATVRVPPIWPGIDNVTLGPILTLETTTLVPGPMHGVCVHISGCEPGTRYFDYDSIRSWSHVGALAFGNERGELEPFQVLGPAAAFYAAKSMAIADSCRLYRSRNVRGTIQSWMVNEG